VGERQCAKYVIEVIKSLLPEGQRAGEEKLKQKGWACVMAVLKVTLLFLF